MKILVVSGFLGAGKTTFIKELIRRTGKFPVVLENEYGENDLDSRALKGSGEIEILEFMEGCVCCTKKDSFINTILAISAAMDPEYLVVEPTGIGRLGSILDSIRKIQYDRISLLSPILILSPRSIGENLSAHGDIFRDQILHARKILFSKAEREDPDELKEAEKLLQLINPRAEILTTHYSLQDDEWWDGLLTVPGEEMIASPRKTGIAADDYQQISLRNAAVSGPAELMILLENILRGAYGMIPRAKGVLRAGGEFLRFDLADGLYGIIRETDPEPKSQCVFIGREIRAEKLLERLRTREKKEDRHPHPHKSFAETPGRLRIRKHHPDKFNSGKISGRKIRQAAVC